MAGDLLICTSIGVSTFLALIDLTPLVLVAPLIRHFEIQHSHNQANDRRPSNMPSAFPLSKRAPDVIEYLAGVWGCVKRYYVPIPVQRRPGLQTRSHARQFVSYNPPLYDEVPPFLGPPADCELPTYGEVTSDAAPPAYYVG